MRGPLGGWHGALVNVKELSKQIGQLFRLRPLPFRVEEDGERLPPIDDQWRLEAVHSAPTRVRLVNLATYHALDLEWDNILERRSPDFLLLRCQLTIRGNAVEIEPIHRGAPVRPQPIKLSSIVTRVREAPLAARTQIEAGFRGVLTRCIGELGSVEPLSGGRMRVGIMEDSGEDVFFELELAKYPRLANAGRRERVEAIGAYVRNFGAVWLEQATLTFIGNATA